ncbi:MAG: CDP-alcohol phosphatidyltransferase family protein [Candidatus Cryptobacteroides sp.]
MRSRPVVFWTLYLLCGLSDVLDGAIARRTGTASRLGEKQDTFADIVFVAIWIAIFIPAINVGDWLKKIMAF